MGPAARIICIGNRLAAEDQAGPRVFDRLGAAPLPPAVELADGGLAGIDLARLVEGVERVVFVDSVAGFGRPGRVVVLSAAEVAAEAEAGFGHGAGLPYLLRMLPVLLDGPLPEVAVVGVEGAAGDAAVEAAAGRSLALAVGTEAMPESEWRGRP